MKWACYGIAFNLTFFFKVAANKEMASAFQIAFIPRIPEPLCFVSLRRLND